MQASIKLNNLSLNDIIKVEKSSFSLIEYIIFYNCLVYWRATKEINNNEQIPFNNIIVVFFKITLKVFNSVNGFSSKIFFFLFSCTQLLRMY